MWKIDGARGSSRVVQFKTRHDPAKTSFTLRHADSAPLDSTLAALRAEMDNLTLKLAREKGPNSESVARAEQTSAAIQRLEWALERERNPPAS